jgi:hypothetical protein
MGLFSNKTTFKAIEIEQPKDNYKSFSTPFQKLPTGNLSLPFVSDRYETRGYTLFGSDNLFPQQLDQTYFSSPLHGAIVDFKTNASVGGGYKIDQSKLSAKERVALYSFEKRLVLDKFIKTLTREYIVHNRSYFLITLKDGETKSIKHVGAAKVRTNKDKTLYTIAQDWTQHLQTKTYKPYDKTCKNGTYIVCFEEQSLGQDIYPLPQYTSALNYAYLSGDMSYLAKSNIQNSVFPSFAIKFPKKPQNNEELTQLQETVNKMKGAENAGKAVAFFANNKDQLPELEAIPTNQNDSLFKEASDLVTEQICFAHTIDPILLGVRTTGSLGNGSDIKQAYIIFEKNVIIPIRERIADIINKLLKISGIDAEIEIVNYQIIEEQITEVNENPTVMALNGLPDDLRAKVMENMSQNEIRALAGLKPQEGGDTTESLKQPQQETQMNDALKGLTAKDNMDIIRIVRDYNKGKLTETLARTRLMAYGFDTETITQILSE